MNGQMTLDEYKKRALDYLIPKSENITMTERVQNLATRIEEESEEFSKDSWLPEVMVQAMASGLV